MILDRIEGDRAILDINGESVEIPTLALPAGAKEGQCFVLVLQEGGTSEAEALLARLKAANPSSGNTFDL